MSQAAINARMLPWGDAEFRRFDFRLALFKRRGLTEREAETLADRLALRDQDRDDRRVCLECIHLQHRGTCFAAAQGWLAGVSKFLEPIPNLLQRCERFEFCKP